MRPTICFIALIVLGILIDSIQAEILADSGNPMRGANPQRNRHITKKVLCPQVAPGRTQVWNLAWSVLPTVEWYSSYDKFTELTQDEEGFIYLQGQAGYLKINSTDGTFDLDNIYVPSFDADAVPTHVKGHVMYIAGDSKSVVVNTTSMQEIAVLMHDVDYSRGSYAPYGANYMISAAPYNEPINVFRYIDTSTLEFDTSQPNITSAYADTVIIYKNASIEIPIVISNFYSQPIRLLSPHYTVTLDGSYWVVASYVQDDQLLVLYYVVETGLMTVSFFNPATGSLYRSVSPSTWQGEAITGSSTFKVIGTKSLFSISVNQKYDLVDLLNSKLLLSDTYVDYELQYSIPDNSVLFYGIDSRAYNNPQEIISLDWDTQTVNAVGSFPIDGNYDDIILSPPLVGDNCMIYAYYDDRYDYKGLYAFEPLPVSDIEPILECIDGEGVGYFSYQNKEDKRIVIPFVQDRNNLSPMNIAPAKDFRARQRGKYFPFSSHVQLDSSASSYSWQLENYVLTFSNTAQLRCPQDVNIVLSFNATNAEPAGFSAWLPQAFVETTANISSARVTLVTSKRRSTMGPNSFQVQLRIAKDSSGQELTAEQAARKFVEKESLETFQMLLAQNDTYFAANITLIDVDGVPLDTEISATTPPQGTPQSPTNNAPKNNPTSAGSAVTISLILILFTIISTL